MTADELEALVAKATDNGATMEERAAAQQYLRYVLEYIAPSLIEALRERERQPIETAPRDGTFVLIHVAHAEPPVSLGYYDGGPDWLMAECDIMPSNCHPTHWRPLPAPPSTDVGE